MKNDVSRRHWKLSPLNASLTSSFLPQPQERCWECLGQEDIESLEMSCFSDNGMGCLAIEVFAFSRHTWSEAGVFLPGLAGGFDCLPLRKNLPRPPILPGQPLVRLRLPTDTGRVSHEGLMPACLAFLG